MVTTMKRAQPTMKKKLTKVMIKQKQAMLQKTREERKKATRKKSFGKF